jgi:Site-specific recombinases, DNA invertase Pin homologs
MRAACYCRVSTDKDEQIESLSKQIEFFENFTKSKEQELYKIYVDEGISGKQLKNRVQFIQMLKDAEKKMFDIIYVKDISRFARNTEDFLHNIRKIKNLGLNIFFLTNNLDVQEGSEFYLTMLAAIAQEESAKLSERVKFGKNVTAKNGRVPNFVFGYDKVDNYTLTPNPRESSIVQKIFDLFVNQNYGTNKIASYLNDNNIQTKKNKQRNWHQVVVTQILRNEIYIGKVINKKSEVTDFITGKRREIPREQQIILERPEFRIISDELFYKAQELLEEKKDKFKLTQKKDSVKFPLSNLIKCSECGYSFRRCQRKYSDNGKIYKWWTCSIRNAKGKNACINSVNIDEELIEKAILQFLNTLVSNKPKAIKFITNEIRQLMTESNSDILNDSESLEKELQERIRQKEKYMDMYKNEIITMDELKDYTKDINNLIQKYRIALNSINDTKNVNMDIENAVSSYFNRVQNIVDNEIIDNQFLKQIIDKIVVFPNGEVKIYLKIENPNDVPIELPLELNT